MQDQKQLLKEKAWEQVIGMNSVHFHQALKEMARKKIFDLFPSIFFLFKEHHVRNFDIVCILMETMQEEEAYLHLCLTSAMMGTCYWTEREKIGKVAFLWTILCAGS
jgi:hypothetical protein